MTRRLTVIALTALVVMALSGVVLKAASPALAAGATQIQGVGFFATPEECDGTGLPVGATWDFALLMTEDLVGCHYITILESTCSPSGTYRERGIETFVGEYNGNQGTFDTTYLFTAKLGDCPDLTTEIWGRCQHPIVAGSGTGGFEGVTGRFDIKDDVEAGNFPYKGHLRY